MLNDRKVTKQRKEFKKKIKCVPFLPFESKCFEYMTFYTPYCIKLFSIVFPFRLKVINVYYFAIFFSFNVCLCFITVHYDVLLIQKYSGVGQHVIIKYKLYFSKSILFFISKMILLFYHTFFTTSYQI